MINFTRCSLANLLVPYIVVGLHAVFSLTGSFFGFPITINVLPRINLHGILIV